MRSIAGNLRGTFQLGRRAPEPQSEDGAVCLLRQPLFNAEEELVGRRLLSSKPDSSSSSGLLTAVPPGQDAELVLAEDLHAVVPRGLVLLDVSRREVLELRALSLPSERVVLCLRADETLDEELQAALDRHAMRGFRLAVDGVDPPSLSRPLVRRAQTVILDTRRCSSTQLEQLVAALRQSVNPPQLLAGSVDSRSAFQTCRRLGFDLFQGQFVLRPTPGPARSVAQAGLGGIGTMADLSATDSFERLGEIITRDPGLSMRLLRYANSAHAALPRRVGSVQEALAWLGTVAVREFAMIAALATVPEAPAEMLRTALIRARMCQQLSARLPGANPEESFTVGLFSVAEAATNAPLADVLSELPLREDVVTALLDGEGDLGRLLTSVVAYERGEFVPAATLAGSTVIAETYLESIRWADSAVDALAW